MLSSDVSNLSMVDRRSGEVETEGCSAQSRCAEMADVSKVLHALVGNTFTLSRTTFSISNAAVIFFLIVCLGLACSREHCS